MVRAPCTEEEGDIDRAFFRNLLDWLPVCNPLHNRSLSPAVNRKPSNQLVIKDQAVPGEAEAALTRISSLCLTITRFHGLFPDFLTS